MLVIFVATEFLGCYRNQTDRLFSVLTYYVGLEDKTNTPSIKQSGTISYECHKHSSAWAFRDDPLDTIRPVPENLDKKTYED